MPIVQEAHMLIDCQSEDNLILIVSLMKKLAAAKSEGFDFDSVSEEVLEKRLQWTYDNALQKNTLLPAKAVMAELMEEYGV